MSWFFFFGWFHSGETDEKAWMPESAAQGGAEQNKKIFNSDNTAEIARITGMLWLSNCTAIL